VGEKKEDIENLLACAPDFLSQSIKTVIQLSKN
jgi:hypothetical protein